ncbi:hypothetical protein NKH18_43735 [Streptomyces sp. M10(2022)]
MGSRFHPEAARCLWRYIEAAPSRADSVLGLRALLVLGDAHYEEGLRRYPDLARLPVVRPGRGAGSRSSDYSYSRPRPTVGVRADSTLQCGAMETVA